MSDLDRINFKIKKISNTEEDATFKIQIKIPISLGFIDGVKYVADTGFSRDAFRLNYIDKDNEYATFEGEATLPTRANYHYYFSFLANNNFMYYKKSNNDKTNHIAQDDMWKMSVNFDVAEWAQGKLWYHIFVDRFYRGSSDELKPMKNRNIHKSWDEEIQMGPDENGIWNNDFYGGDLKGIIEKLDYIKSLGVSVLYLSPIVTSQSNHRYDTSDYEKVDPYAGSNEDLKRLCKKAHQKGMRVILDAVFNHTGNDSKYFNELDTYDELGAYQSKDSKYYPFYRKERYYDEGYKSYWDWKDKFPPFSKENEKWLAYIFEAKGIIDLWYHFDKEHKTEPQENTLSEEVQKWAEELFHTKLNLDFNTIKFENNQFWYRVDQNWIPIANRMMYVLFSQKDIIETFQTGKDIINFISIEALLTFYKTKNGDKLSLIMDEFKKRYPENTIEHIVEYIRKQDITKIVKEMTNEEIDENRKKPYRKYLHNKREMFYYWWGMGNLPVCDGNSKEWQEYIYGKGGVIDKWFQLGIDGLRLDVADELSDEFIEGIRKAVKRNKKDGYVIGEVWKNPMRMGRGYIESGKGMDSVMNYPLIDALISYYKNGNVGKLKEVLRQLQTEYPEEVLRSLMNFTSTHDISRILNILGSNDFQYNGEWAWNVREEDRNWQLKYQLTPEQYELAKKRYASYLYNLTFMPGNLSIYYGDEVGLQGMGNLANRRPLPWNKIDTDILNIVKRAGKTREEQPFLEQAGFETIDVNDCYQQYRRADENVDALISVSRTDAPTRLYIPDYYRDADLLYPLGNSNRDELDSFGGVVLKKVKKR